PLEEPADPAQVPVQQRLADAKLLVKGMNCTRRGEVAEDRAARITWQDLAGQEYDHAKNPQREQHKTQAPHKEQRHFWPPCRTAVHRGTLANWGTVATLGSLRDDRLTVDR